MVWVPESAYKHGASLPTQLLHIPNMEYVLNKTTLRYRDHTWRKLRIGFHRSFQVRVERQKRKTRGVTLSLFPQPQTFLLKRMDPPEEEKLRHPPNPLLSLRRLNLILTQGLRKGWQPQVAGTQHQREYEVGSTQCGGQLSNVWNDT